MEQQHIHQKINDEAHQSFLMIFALLPDPLGFYSHDSLSLFLQQHLYITL